MARIEDIKQRWQEHERVPFPKGLRGKSIAGTDLTLLQSNIARFILAAIELNAPLAPRSKSMLDGQREVLAEVLGALEGDARVYFERLRGLADDVAKL